MKTKYQFDLAEFNPDAMTVEELHEWIAFIGNGQRPQVAKQWFPGAKGQFALARAIRNYCWNKITAMELRIKGEINKAMEYEAICDRIYNDIPSEYRW